MSRLIYRINVVFTGDRGSCLTRQVRYNVLVLVNRARYHFATMQTMRTTYAVYGYMYAYTRARARTCAHRIRVARADNVARSIFHRRAHSSVRNFIFNPQPYREESGLPVYAARLLPSRELWSRVPLSF